MNHAITSVVFLKHEEEQMIIDAHGHILPAPEKFPEFMKRQQVLWLEEISHQWYMRQGEKWCRPVSKSNWGVHARLDWMEQNGIDFQVLITLSQLYCNTIGKSLAFDVIQFQNDFQAQLQGENPQFITGFVVQPAFPRHAVREIERCVQMGMKVLCLPTHFFHPGTGWCATTDHSNTLQILEVANEHDLAVQFHPYDADKMVHMLNKNWRFHNIGMPYQTADAFYFFALNGLAHKYPNVRFCFSHGASVAAALHGRWYQGFAGRPDLFQGCHDPKESFGHENVFVDSIVHCPITLAMVQKVFGIKQVVFGTDCPYPLGEMKLEGGGRDTYPGKALDQLVEMDIGVTEQDKDLVNAENVIRWLGYNPSKA